MASLFLFGAGPVAAAPKIPSKAPSKVTFGVQPATKGRVDQRSFLSYATTPGARVEDAVALVNYSTSPLKLSVLVTDAVNTQSGGFGLLPTRDRPRDLGAWIRLKAPHGLITVPKRSATGPGTFVIPLTLDVPRNAEPGDHVAGIAAILTTTTDRPGAPNVALEQRVATRMFLRVSGPLKPKLVVDDFTVTYHGTLNPVGKGWVDVSYVLRNEGNVKLGARQRLEVKGLVGGLRTPAKLDAVPLLFPGGSATIRTEIRDITPLVWETARLRLLPLKLQGDLDPPLPETTATTHFWAVPWTLLAAVLGLIMLIIGRRIRRGRRNRPKPTAPLRPVTVQDPPPEPADARGGRTTRRVAVGVAAVMATTASLVSGPAGAAEKPPYDDANAVAGIGLCDKAGRPVTSGSLSQQPFSHLAVGTQRPPAGYDGSTRTATLYAYQPRKGVDPGQWSGEQLNSGARYSNPRAPMSTSLPDDYSLGMFAENFPPRWDGWVQLRMVLSAAGAPGFSEKYAAADVKISGDRWEVVNPASVDCRAGSAKALAEILGVATPPPSGKPSKASSSAASPGTSRGSSGKGASTSPTVSPGTAGSTTPSPTPGSARSSSPAAAAAGDDSRASGDDGPRGGPLSSPLVWLALLLAAVGGAGAWLARGRLTPSHVRNSR